MHASIVAGSLIAALSLATPLHGQQVMAQVVVRSGPVTGHVTVENGYSSYRRPVVYRRAPARVVVVERVAHRHHRHTFGRGNNYRRVTLWYYDGRYYDRAVRDWPGMREVIVYQRDGRYYDDCDDRN
ncbi:MAG TPA: hypothetical protein VF046_05880 [Gemmatimonadales bacterium]